MQWSLALVVIKFSSQALGVHAVVISIRRNRIQFASSDRNHVHLVKFSSQALGLHAVATGTRRNQFQFASSGHLPGYPLAVCTGCMQW